VQRYKKIGKYSLHREETSISLFMQSFDKTNFIDFFGDKKRFREFFFSKGVAI